MLLECRCLLRSACCLLLVACFNVLAAVSASAFLLYVLDPFKAFKGVRVGRCVRRRSTLPGSVCWSRGNAVANVVVVWMRREDELERLGGEEGTRGKGGHRWLARCGKGGADRSVQQRGHNVAGLGLREVFDQVGQSGDRRAGRRGSSLSEGGAGLAW